MNEVRPLLLLDVDGPLNPWKANPSRRDRLPLDYKTLRLRPRGWEHERKPLRVWLSEAHGPMLLDFAAEHGFELAWATTWNDEANTLIGPEIGLPELLVIDVGVRPTVTPGWKFPAVRAYAGARPLVWLDDDFDHAPYQAARWEFLRLREPTPTLLHDVDPRLGLTEMDLRAVARRWRQLTTDTEPADTTEEV